MKTLVSKLLKYSLARAGGLLVIIAAVAASLAWSGPSHARIKLEGAWIATVDSGVRGLVTYSPTDPSGQSATFRNEMVWPASVLASMGIEAVTDEVAEEFVTKNGVSRYHGVWYGLAGGNIVLIFLDDSVITYESPTYCTIQHTIATYLASADADNDGYPDPGTTPVATSSVTSIGKRVTR
jgi:hypothetical protein